MSEPKLKQGTFGTVAMDKFAPEDFLNSEAAPKVFTVNLTFEEALKLHLGIGQCLAKLNGYNRSTREGKAAGMSLRLYNYKNKIGRITIDESKTGAHKKGKRS